MRYHSLIFLAVLLWQPVLARPLLPKSANVPGGIAIVQLDEESTTPPRVYYQDQRTLVMPDPNHKHKWLTIVGIPLDAKAGPHQVQIYSEQKSSYKKFNVKSKTYPHQHLTIADTRKVLPLAEDLPMIEEQYLTTIETYKHWEYKPLTSAMLKLPVKGRKSSPFGIQRFMNKIPQHPHSGIDIAARKGTAVKASKEGTVINVGHYFYSGKIVFIDHGQGFITSYCHLDSVIVKVGQQVKEGQVIGSIGTTGRATGPHLHWSVSLNGVRVDPEWFIYE